MSSEEEDYIKQLEEEEKFYKKCESDNIGFQDNSETDSSDISDDGSMKDNCKRPLVKSNFIRKKRKLPEYMNVKIPWVQYNRIKYIKHCVDEISDIKFDNYVERKRKCITAILRLDVKYINGVKEYLKDINNKFTIEFFIKNQKKYEDYKKMSKIMCKWLNIKEQPVIFEEYSEFKERKSILQLLYNICLDKENNVVNLNNSK